MHDWKSCVPGTVPGVRIPSPPPLTRKSQQPNVQFGGFSGSEGKSGPKLGAFDFHLSIDAQRQDDSTPTRQTSCVSWSCQRWPVNSARPGREQRSRLPACGGAFLILGPAGADPRLTSSAPRSRYRCTARSAPAGALAARPRLNPDLGVGPTRGLRPVVVNSGTRKSAWCAVAVGSGVAERRSCERRFSRRAFCVERRGARVRRACSRVGWACHGRASTGGGAGSALSSIGFSKRSQGAL